MKRLKIQKVSVICIIRWFRKIEKFFNYIQAKFRVAGFQSKGDVRHRLFIFTRTFTGSYDLVVSCL